MAEIDVEEPIQLDIFIQKHDPDKEKTHDIKEGIQRLKLFLIANNNVPQKNIRTALLYSPQHCYKIKWDTMTNSRCLPFTNDLLISSVTLYGFPESLVKASSVLLVFSYQRGEKFQL